jgi:hypothetical protein
MEGPGSPDMAGGGRRERDDEGKAVWAGCADGGLPVPVGGERGEEEMSRLFVANAFSLEMVPTTTGMVYLRVREIDTQTASTLLRSQPFISAIGHESTAKLLSEILGVDIPVNRIQLQLQKGDVLVVVQLLTRLEEGRVLTKEELQKIPHKFFIVELVDNPVTPPQRG